MSRATVLLLLFAFATAVLAVAPFVGRIDVPLGALWGDVEDETQILVLWELRIPRVVMALLAGAALAAGGMAFQALFRNPLATPFTLGISSGAALGATLSIHLGLSFSILRFSSVSLFAFVGALLSIGLVYGLSRVRRGFSSTTMLLAGVAVSFFFSSLILCLQFVSDPTKTFRMLRWVMGGLSSELGFHNVLGVVPLVIAGCAILWYLTHDLNLFTTGEELAAARGVDVGRTKAAVFLAASLMVGGVVSVCGPIGFVGLVAPHICRMLIGPDHRWLTPATMLFGGAFLVLCDTLARTAPTQLPVGIITSLLGGPFFLWLLLRRNISY